MNPFIVQDYKSNTLFKSLTATLRIRKWPVVSVGYQPMSQYTKVDDQVIENRFQTFNATLYHYYTVHQLKMATTIMVNKFLNNNTDTGFLYYNATNSYFTQTFYFNETKARHNRLAFFIFFFNFFICRISTFIISFLSGGYPGKG